MRLALQSNCDQSKPDQAHQWVFTDLPFGQDQTFTPDHKLIPEWSQRLDDAGYRHVDQIRALANEDGFIHVDQLPPAAQALPAAVPRPTALPQPRGGLVRHGRAGPGAFTIPDPAAHTPHEQAAMAERMYYTGVLKRAEPEPDKASVSRAPVQPVRPHRRVGEHLPRVGAADDAERSRVLAAEMLGKKRQQILRNPKWKGL